MSVIDCFLVYFKVILVLHWMHVYSRMATLMRVLRPDIFSSAAAPVGRSPEAVTLVTITLVNRMFERKVTGFRNHNLRINEELNTHHPNHYNALCYITLDK